VPSAPPAVATTYFEYDYFYFQTFTNQAPTPAHVTNVVHQQKMTHQMHTVCCTHEYALQMYIHMYISISAYSSMHCKCIHCTNVCTNTSCTYICTVCVALYIHTYSMRYTLHPYVQCILAVHTYVQYALHCSCTYIFTVRDSILCILYICMYKYNATHTAHVYVQLQ